MHYATSDGDGNKKGFRQGGEQATQGTLVDFMTVYSKEDISVTFKDGTEIHIS